MPDYLDPRERAFMALVPLAPTVARVLSEVDACVVDDAARNASARAPWTPIQRKTSAGYGRFCWATQGLKDGLRRVKNVSYISAPWHEASNVFLWQVDGWLTLRVKSEPSELAYEATEPLFARDSSICDETVCLSWTITLQQTIRDARFVSVHVCSPWSIALAELLSDSGHDGGPPQGGVILPVPPRRPGPGVRSKRLPRPGEDDADTPSSD